MPRKIGTPRRRKREADKLPSLLLGAHMSISGGPCKALERGRSIGCTAIQIFVKNNMQWFAKAFVETELASYHAHPDPPTIVFGHTSYLINPGAKNPEFREKSIRALQEELSRADQLGLPFLVLIQARIWGKAKRPVLPALFPASTPCLLPCRWQVSHRTGNHRRPGNLSRDGFEHLATIIERSSSRNA